MRPRGEDGALDLFDVGDDGAVAFDHLVEDCQSTELVGAQCEQFGVLFESPSRAVQLTRDTLPTVITKLAPTKMLISPKSTLSWL